MNNICNKEKTLGTIWYIIKMLVFKENSPDLCVKITIYCAFKLAIVIRSGSMQVQYLHKRSMLLIQYNKLMILIRTMGSTLSMWWLIGCQTQLGWQPTLMLVWWSMVIKVVAHSSISKQGHYHFLWFFPFLVMLITCYLDKIVIKVVDHHQ